MNYIKRAIQSLWAKKGRSILMIAVFSAILIFVLAGLTIRSGADLATTNAKKSVGATVTLSTNREAMFKTPNQILMEKAADQIPEASNRHRSI